MKSHELKCDDCPAIELKKREGQLLKIKQWEKMRSRAIEEITKIKLYLLCESIPVDRFFYDLDRDYTKDGLRFEIKEELELESDQAVLMYFRRNGIVLADCALCPLHLLGSSAKKKRAASICLKNNTNSVLHINDDAPIITIFPCNRGFIQNDFPEIQERVKDEFPFTDISGLQQSIERFTK